MLAHQRRIERSNMNINGTQSQLLKVLSQSENDWFVFSNSYGLWRVSKFRKRSASFQTRMPPAATFVYAGILLVLIQSIGGMLDERHSVEKNRLDKKFRRFQVPPFADKTLINRAVSLQVTLETMCLLLAVFFEACACYNLIFDKSFRSAPRRRANFHRLIAEPD